MIDGFAPVDVAFARMIGRRAGADDDVTLAAALVSAAIGAGHAALDLTRADLVIPPESGVVLPDPAVWRRKLAASPAVRAPDGPPAPLVLHGDLLTLDRVYRQEQALAGMFRQRAATARTDVDEAALRSSLDREFARAERPPVDPAQARSSARAVPGEAPSARAEQRHAVARTAQRAEGERSEGELADDLQRRAAETAARRGLTVIVGGPGTGKTVTVSKIVAVLRDQAASLGAREPRVVMVAPTGKAAARLTEATGMPASTLHRALALRPGMSVDVPPEPLVADLVVVDEASMVDLALMTRLVAAVPTGARLILLGDADQLASVENGSVLVDLCRASGPVAQAVTRLERSYRFPAGSPIDRLARAINAGDPDTALAVLAEGGAVERVEVRSARDLQGALRPLAVAAWRDVAAAPSPAEALAALAGFRVLCAHRQGAWGADAVARRIEEWLTAERLMGPRQHQPVLVTENDHAQRLYNGDTGLLRDGLVWFSDAGGPRALSPARLPRHESACASSVHKAQGSEYGHVVVVLPDQPSPIVTRELLYTAITRATRRVTLVATADALRAGVAATSARITGLRAHLAG